MKCDVVKNYPERSQDESYDHEASTQDENYDHEAADCTMDDTDDNLHMG